MFKMIGENAYLTKFALNKQEVKWRENRKTKHNK